MSSGSRIVVDQCTQSEILMASYTNEQFEPHFHRSYSFGVILQGQCKFVCSGRQWTANAGDICAMHPYQTHTGGSDAHKLEYRMIYPPTSWMSRLCDSSKKTLPFFSSPIIRDSECFKVLSTALCDYGAGTERCEEDGVTQERAFNLIVQAIQQIAMKHAVSSGIFRSPSEGHDAIGLACRYMENRWNDSISFSDVADAVGLSRYHFSRQFKKRTGIQPRSYLRQVRLGVAKELIVTGGNLAVVSAAAGFADQAHMTREFKKVYGVTPGHIKAVSGSRGLASTL